MSTIRVRMLTMAAGPDFQLHPGFEGALPAAQAEALIAGGYAMRLSPADSAPAATAPAPVEARPAEPEQDDPDAEEEEAAAVESQAPEKATAGPQRSAEADDTVAAEKAGRDAAAANEPRSANPNDRRTGLGRAWDRGWVAGQK